MTTTLIAEHQIGHNHSDSYSVSDDIDPTTGNRKIKADIEFVNPGEWVDWPDDDEAAQLIAAGHARLPTREEVQLRSLQT